MKRTNQCADRALTTTGATNPVAGLDAYEQATASDRATNACKAVQEHQPPQKAFDARVRRDTLSAAPTDQAVVRRTIRRKELRQIVPLADSTVYELERRGSFPQRFFLTARCVVWDLAEVEAWLRSRRQPEGSDFVKKVPVPDFRKRPPRSAMDNR